MASMNVVEQVHQRKGQPRLKRANVKIDMTPRVDLGFLLICFFVFTTTMSQAKALVLFMPMAGPPMPVADSKSFTVLTGKNDQVFYYFGNWETARREHAIYKTNYSVYQGLGNVIRAKQKNLAGTGNDQTASKALLLIIKPGQQASYKNLVDVLDEVLINNVTRYVIDEPTADEAKFLQN